MKKIILSVLSLSSLVVLAAGIYFLTPTLPDLIEATCDRLPTTQQVETVLAEQAAIRKRIEAPGRGIWIGYDERSQRCPGKADLVIYYDTLETRAHIKALIGETFFGIPYRMKNT